MSGAAMLTGLAIGVLLTVRLLLTFRCHVRRLDEVHAHYQRNLAAFAADGGALYDAAPSLGADMFDLRKWTYRQFFPEVLS